MIKPSDISKLIYTDFSAIVPQLYPLVIKDPTIQGIFGTYEISNYRFTSTKDGTYDDELTANVTLKISAPSYGEMQQTANSIVELISNDSKYETFGYSEDFQLDYGLYVATYIITITWQI